MFAPLNQVKRAINKQFELLINCIKFANSENSNELKTRAANEMVGVFREGLEGGLITNSRQSTRASLKKQISEHAKHM